MVYDAFHNPVPGAPVVLTDTGSGTTLIPPLTPTGSDGRTHGVISGAAAETVTVTASASGTLLLDTAQVRFMGPDLVTSKSGPATALAGRVVTYALTVRNQSPDVAPGVVLTDTLPPDLTFLAHSGSYTFTQDGRTLTWELGDLAPYASVGVQMSARLTTTLADGATVANPAYATTAGAEENPADNVATATTTIVPGYVHTVAIDPEQFTTGPGGEARYTVEVRNTGYLADEVDMALSGLDPAWYALEPAQLSLIPGERKLAELTVTVAGCAATGQSYPFTVTATSAGSGEARAAGGDFALSAQPMISDLTPAHHTLIGNTSAHVTWRTVTSATNAFVRIWPAGQITQSQIYPATTSGLQHSVTITGLQRNTAYRWYAHAESACATEDSAERILRVGNGIVFRQAQRTYRIRRDYDQQVMLMVTNQDVVSHTLLLTITEPLEGDLIVGFVGSGSSDERITLQPGETHYATLALHAQDAQSWDYALTAHLVSDDESTPIRDAIPVHVHIAELNVDFTLEEIAFDPTNLERTFRITNHGDPLTDLAVDVETTSGTSSFYLHPGINHAHLKPNKSIDFIVYPALDGSTAPFTATLTASAAGVTRSHVLTMGLPAGHNLYKVTLNDVALQAHNADWYCTNKPELHSELHFPRGVRRANVTSSKLALSLAPHYLLFLAKVRPHNLDASVNDHLVGGFKDLIPNGVYAYPVLPDYVSEAPHTISVNDVGLLTTHMNGGHYVVASEISMEICLDHYEEWVAATSQAEADAIVAARDYVLIPPSALEINLLAPLSGQHFLAGLPISVTAHISDDVGSNSYVVTARTSAAGEGFYLYDDGSHSDGASGDGVYGGTWIPQEARTYTLTVETGSCTIQGSDAVTVTVADLTYDVTVRHRIPTTVTALIEAADPLPDSFITTGEATTVKWQQVLTAGAQSQVIALQSVLTDVLPGEVRRIAEGSFITYTGESGAGQIALGPLYVAAPHIVAVAPFSQTAGPGQRVAYTASLYNPGPASGTFTLTLAGLPTGWTGDPVTLWIEAGAYATHTLTIDIPEDAPYAAHDFAVLAHTPTGCVDQAGATLNVADRFALHLAPTYRGGYSGDVVTYTATITNMGSTTRTYALSLAGLEASTFEMPPQVMVPALSTAAVPLTLTLYERRGMHSIRLYATPTGTEIYDSDDALLVALADRRVQAGLNPMHAEGGPETPTLYQLTITNTGHLSDTYAVSVDLPGGWSYALEANGEPVDPLQLTPYLFNAADLILIVTPAADADPDTYDLPLTVQSLHDPNTRARLTPTLALLPYGVALAIDPPERILAPTDSATWQIIVTNTGTMPDTYRISASGIVSAAANFGESPLYLSAGESRSVTLNSGEMDFALTQRYPFAVTAQSMSHDAIRNHDEGGVTFSGYEAVKVGLLPQQVTLTDTLTAHYMVLITNTGNVPTVYNFAAGASPALPSLDLEIDDLYIPPHMTAGILLTARGREAGTYTVTVWAASDAGTEHTGTGTLVIEGSAANQPPVAVDDAVNTAAGTPRTIPVLANDSDPDGDALTLLAVGMPLSGTVVPLTATVTYTPATGFAGTDAFAYTISDGALTATARVTVTVTPTAANQPPVAVDDAITTAQETPVAIDLLANDSDPDGDALTLFAVGTPLSGTVAPLTATVTYTPATGFAGTDAFAYTISDGALTATARVTVTVTPTAANQPPVAVDDAVNTAAGTPCTIPVLANDSDPDGDALTLLAVGMPLSGTVAPLTATVTYTPATGFAGTDAFSYTISDGALTATARVTVTVGTPNRAPVAASDLITTPEDTPTSIAVLDNDGDPDGDVLVVAQVGTPGHGTVRIVEATVTYTPALNFAGTDAFTYTISDGALTATARVTVTVTPVNDPPEISDVPDQVVGGETFIGPIPFTVVDVETSPGELNVSGESSDPQIIPPSGFVFGGSGATRTLTIHPTALTGTARLTLTVSDGEDSAYDTFTLSMQKRGSQHIYLPLIVRSYPAARKLYLPLIIKE